MMNLTFMEDISSQIMFTEGCATDYLLNHRLFYVGGGHWRKPFLPQAAGTYCDVAYVMSAVSMKPWWNIDM